MEYQQMKGTYLSYAEGKSVPVKLQQKIQLLVSLIRGQRINLENIIDIPFREIDRFSALTVQQQKKIAIELMQKAISTKDILGPQFIETACLIKKEGFLNQWFQTFMHFHNKKLLFTILVNGQEGKHLYEFDVGEVTLSQNFKKFKNRKGFVINSKGKQYNLAFNHQSACDKTYKQLVKLIEKENNSTEIDRSSNKSIQFQEAPKHNSATKSQKWTHVVPFQSQENYVKQQQKQPQQEISINSSEYQNTKYKRQTFKIVDNIRRKLDEQDSFKLVKNMKNGQILVHKDNKFQVKIIMILHCESAIQIMEHYTSQQKWNPQIEQETILAKTQTNGYIISRKIKSNSKVFWPLQCIFQRKVVPYAGSIYIIDQTIDHEQYQSTHVKSKLSAITEISPRRPKQWMFTTVSELTSQSFFYRLNTENLHMKCLDNLQYFQVFIDSRSTKKSNNKKKPLFQIEVVDNSLIDQQTESLSRSTLSMPPTHRILQQQANILKVNKSQILSANVKHLKQQEKSCQSLINASKEIKNFKVSEQIDGYSDLSQQKVNIKECKELKYQFFDKILLKDQHSIPTKQYFEAIQQKQYERYYLAKKFSLDKLQSQNFLRHSEGFIYQTKEWIVNKQRQLIYVNKQLLDAQKGVLAFVIKQIGSNLFSGKSIMSMSLPVDVFSKDSFLEFLASSFGYAPVYLPRAAEMDDPIQQMKLVALFAINSPTLSLKIEKPFNPILGQTFTGYLGGIPVFLQQISHHPPVCAFLMKTDTFIFHGQTKMSANMGLNSAVGMNLSFQNIEFINTGCHFKIFQPEVEVSGLVYGDRKFKLTGKAIITQEKNNLYAQIQFGSNKNSAYQFVHANPKDLKGCSVNGIICKVNQNFYQGFNTMISKQKKPKYANIKSNQIKEKITQVYGQFISKVYFDGKEVKNQTIDLPFPVEYYQTPLPSDSNFREDIIYRRIQNNKKSQQRKQFLQDLQRSDKKLRLNNNSKR